MGVLPSGIEEGDFDLIQAAVRETERGRWFLDEFARRVRADDASRIVSAIDDLSQRLAARQAADDQTRNHLEAVITLLAAMAEALDVRKRDLGAERRTAPQGGSTPPAPKSTFERPGETDASGLVDELKPLG